MLGYITSHDQWLYPDMTLKEIKAKTSIHMARNGEEGIKILYKAEHELDKVLVKVQEDNGLKVTVHEMMDVFVGYNERENMIQDGQFVILDEEYEKPYFCTRKAPFRVYEAVKPVEEAIKVNHGHFPLYLTIGGNDLEDLIKEKEKRSVLVDLCDPKDGRVLETIHIEVNIYPVSIPDESLNVTNWFSIKNMATYHDIQEGSQKHLDMIRKYAKLMRRLRQTHFFIQLEYDEKVKADDYDFQALKPIIEIFFQEGFKVMEIGPFIIKSPNSFTSDFKCAFNSDLKVGTDEGYYELQKFIIKLKSFLKDNKWDEKTVFHISDEPDVHIDSYSALEKRKQDYFKVSNLIKKHLPQAKVIEAVKSTEFKSAIDIWVPLTSNFEEFKEDFDRLKKYGDEVWCYVCCAPIGQHLNRFLDIELLKSRLLFWGVSKYDLTGYLHWGLNQYPDMEFNPFEDSNAPNVEFNGLFPSGDAFMVYPGKEGPLMGMRFEAQRKGAQDYELLELLKNKDQNKYKDIMTKVLSGFSQYNSDIENFEKMRIKLLENLS